MRALIFDKSLSFTARHPQPAAAAGDTLIKIRQAGICATDLEITKGYMNFAGVLGHEFVGVVVESPRAELVGQRVVGEINVVCGRCDLCMSGLANHCRNRSVLGILNHDGAFADYVRLPAMNLHVVPKNVDDDAAVFTEPLAAAFQVLKQVPGLGSGGGGKWVTVLGDGRLGLLVAQVLRDAGCPVRVIGKHADKLAMCEKWGIRARALADIVPRHDQDLVVDCTGNAGGLELAMQMVRPRGTVVLKTTAAAGKPLNLAPVVIDEITILGSRCGPFREALAALSAGRIDVASLIHRRMKLEQGIEAMALAARPGVIKVLLMME
ncbi:MAG TPA: alcohol dehydrogenase catalytic domain-containing protein [Tepidisphaeraceae bacterium]|jgi:threonine dehydrogenase-like Zn-dependent dehydrogenase|nr:alcohol dehydrogenase catalytic domain-containing protein [Tepidisphaeraceae bacterium]